MKKGVKYLGTEKLSSYIELLQQMVYDIQEVGVKTSMCAEYGGITEKEKESIHLKLYNKIKFADKALLECMTELNSRLKSDMGMSFGFKEVDAFLTKIKEEHPTILMTKEVFKMRQAELEKKAAMQVIKDSPVEQAIEEHPETVKKSGTKSTKK